MRGYRPRLLSGSALTSGNGIFWPSLSSAFRFWKDACGFPDISVLSRDQPMEPIVRVPPIICCEVLSRSDMMRSLRDRANDYLKFGVKHVWAFDPVLREAFVCDAKGFHAPDKQELIVPKTAIYLPLQQIFAELD
jgi:Uma2 family endonuclease